MYNTSRAEVLLCSKVTSSFYDLRIVASNVNDLKFIEKKIFGQSFSKTKSLIELNSLKKLKVIKLILKIKTVINLNFYFKYFNTELINKKKLLANS